MTEVCPFFNEPDDFSDFFCSACWKMLECHGAKMEVMTFKSVIGMAGLGVGPCEHEIEL